MFNLKNKKFWPIDLIIEFILIILSIKFIYGLYILKAIPTLWITIISIVLLIINLIFIICILRFIGIKTRIFYIIIQLILCGLILYASSFSDKVNTTIEKITELKDYHTYKISIVTLNDSNINSINDLQDKYVGTQTGIDIENTNYVLDSLKKENISFIESKSKDYIFLAKLLSEKNIQALIINEAYLNSIYDSVPALKNKLKVIKTYERIQKFTSSTSSKDITQETFSVLVSGMDEVGDPTQNLHSDVNMLFIINPKLHHIAMVSFPRDAYMPNTALANYNDKLTHTGNYGVETTKASMENLLGFKIDFYTKISFSSLVEIVDAMDKIEVDVPIDFCEQDANRNFNNMICLKKGIQEVNGAQALAFARHRKSYINQDIARNKAQQQVIKGIIKKLTSLEGVEVIPDVLDVIPNYVLTNISSNQIRSFVLNQLENPHSWSMETIHLNQGQYDSKITASWTYSPLDVYLFKRSELQKVVDTYYRLSNNQINLNSFKYDLNNLDTNRKLLPAHPEMEFSDESFYSGEENNSGTEIIK